MKSTYAFGQTQKRAAGRFVMAYWRCRTAGIQFAVRRDDLLSIVSPSKSCIVVTDVKRPRSSKQFTLTTACTPSLNSATAAINTPQRRQMRKSASGGSESIPLH